ncbi:MAG: carboxypeptidase-like regulatory domain-containing protein [Gemmataceae bacterium]|nr:carboxypeptidase-like regulatory domain-containing protein [Gemmataceae bacterium]MCI0742225.1 carboxypeptidase-like regulatory domain-containing protein [Gemmataceae bacterium]
MTRFASAFCCLFCLFAFGCSTDNRCDVSGTVTLAGKSLDQGTIMFVSVDEKSGNQVSALINNGSYKIPRDGGLQPGKYRVAISSPDGKTPDPVAAPDALPGPTGNFSSKERVPAKYNTESQLEIEIKQGQSNRFDFPIP